MRYVLAMVVTGILVAAGVAFVSQTERSVERIFRQALRDAKAAGQLPEGIDPETARRDDFGLEVPSSLMWRIRLSHFLERFRFVLIALLAVGSLAVAHALRSRDPPSKAICLNQAKSRSRRNKGE